MEERLEFDFNYPPDLPICEHRDEILSLLKRNQVVIVCGDTGSGKTTQLPKMAMELGRGANGRRIACTQPRRLAAVTVAERVAQELKTPLGGVIGFQHRFGRQVSDDTRVKFMTDGVLLAETRSDPLLRAYDTIIIDEAHERTLNVDFLLGILKRLLPRRRDLKVIVSSATLDTERFSQFFDNAPALIVPGRLFPIEIRHLSPEDAEDIDLPRDIASALRTLPSHADTLVFLPGERDIRETADHLGRSPFFRNDEIIPLLASLPAGEQQRAFRTSAKRRVILATNVAETSVTIPGIRAVIDSGLARISRYVHRTQVQRLQIEPVSQASARQRSGRCGRVGPGICIRLFSEEDFNARDPYTPPEILRSSLAGVILTMLDLRLGDISTFPFIDPPKPTMIREGLRELLELGAIAHAPRRGEVPSAGGEDRIVLTKTGRQLARIPVEPRLARMLLAASELATLPSVLPLVAAMSCDDPKRRPVDEKERADQAHAPFREPGSDFLGTLKLWRWWDDQNKALSQSQLRKLATKTYLSYPKLREWRDIVRQLTDLSKRLKLDTENDNGGPDALHRALMSGLLGRLGHLHPEDLDYRGAHGLRFDLHPSSVLTKRISRPKPNPHLPTSKQPKHPPTTPEWIMAGELVDTSRLFARNAAAIDPRWIEAVAGPICKHSYRDPEWDAEHGFVRATEQVTLYGLVIVPARRRDFSSIDPVTSRKLFLLHGLVYGDFPHPSPAVRENLALLAEMRKRAERMRQPELFDTDRLTAFFDQVVPPEIVSAGDLKKWLYSATPEERSRFRLKKNEWLPSTGLSSAAFPESIRLGNAKIALSYRHTPDDPEADGITATVRKADASVLRLWRADWLVPGALPEKVNCILNSLPSAQRRVLAPIADTVAVIVPLLQGRGAGAGPADEVPRGRYSDFPLVEAIRKVLLEHNGILIPAELFDTIKVPNHRRARVRIRADESGESLSCSRDLEEALAKAGIESRQGSAGASVGYDTGKHTSWDFGSLAATHAGRSGGLQIESHPALQDEGDGVTIRLFKDAAVAAAVHEGGVTRLMALALAPNGKTDDVWWTAIREAAVRGQAPILSPDDFAQRLSSCRKAIGTLRQKLEADVKFIDREVKELLWSAEGLAEDIYDAIETQIAWLTFPGFVKSVPYARLGDYPRYLRALRTRIERARLSPSSDRTKEARFEPYWDQYRELVTNKKAIIADRKALVEYRWLLEEYRISLFAQEQGTRVSVSPKRLAETWVQATVR